MAWGEKWLFSTITCAGQVWWLMQWRLLKIMYRAMEIRENTVAITVFGRVTERFNRFGTLLNYNLSRGPGGYDSAWMLEIWQPSVPGTTTALDITQHFL
jgi:hypothetical protein